MKVFNLNILDMKGEATEIDVFRHVFILLLDEYLCLLKTC